MFTVHATRKLLDKVKPDLGDTPEPSTVLGNWYGTALFTRPRHLVLLVNEATLLPIVMPLAPARRLGSRIADEAGEVFEAHGFGADFVSQEVAAMTEVAFAKTANRSVNGSLTELAFQAELRLSRHGDDLVGLAMDLSGVPCGALRKSYSFPCDEARAAVAAWRGEPYEPVRRRGLRAVASAPVPVEPEPVDGPGMLVADLGHFDDIPDGAAPELLQLATHLRHVVSAATAGDAGGPWPSALPCLHRDGAAACAGHIVVSRIEVPASIEWRCSACGDAGIISGWQDSPYDLRPRGQTQVGSGDSATAVVPAHVGDVLRDILVLDRDTERLVFAARTTPAGVELSGDADDLEELVGFLAGEANHEPDRKRQKFLDAALDTLETALSRSS